MEDGDTEEPCGEGTPAPFDNEILGGHVNYSALIGPARNLKGKLRDLVVRFDHQSPLFATSTGAAQANLRVGFSEHNSSFYDASSLPFVLLLILCTSCI